MPFLAPIVTAVAGWVGTTLAAGGIGAMLLRLGGSLLLSYASQALMPKPKTPARTVTVRAPVMPRDMVYGRARKGGVIVFLHASGAKSQFVHLVVVLAAHRVKAIGAVWFEGEMAVNAAGVAQGRWAGKVTLEKRLGGEDQTAFASLMANLPEMWTAEHRLAGCAAIYLRLAYDQDAFPGGIPNIAVDIEGKDDILDPRTGIRGYSENAALCLADYMAHPRFGIGAAIGAGDGIDAAALIEGLTGSGWIWQSLFGAPPGTEPPPEEVADGGIEPRYACNGVVSLAQDPKTVIEAMLSAMAGRVAHAGGAWRLMAGAYRLPEITLTADDVRAGGMVLATRVSRAASFNAVRGQFVSPENDWQADDFPAVTSEVYRAEDGGEEVWRDLSLPFTISSSAAQRLAKIELERARRQMSLRIAGKLSAWAAAVGETVMLDYARWGFAAKPFEVQSVSLDLTAAGDGAALLPELVLRETSPLVYDWDASEEAIYAAAPRTTLPSAFDVPPPGVPQVQEELYVTRDGAGVKALARLEWTAAASGFVSQYQIEARRAGAGADDWALQARTDATSLEIRDIAPGAWEFRVKALSVLGVSSEWRTTSAEILGLSAPPAALTGLTLQTAGGLAILKWQRSPDADVRLGGNIVIRHSGEATPSWAASYSMDRVSGNEAIAVLPLKPGAYLLRAEDSGGRLGPMVSVATAGAQALAFAPLTHLEAAPQFSGTHAGTATRDGALTLGAAAMLDDWSDLDAVASFDWEGGVVAEGIYSFAAGIDFGAVTRARLRSVIAVAGFAVFDRIDARAALLDAWEDFDGAEGAEVDVVLEFRETDDDPGGPGPAWSGWSRIDGHEIEARAVQARAILRTADAAFAPRVSALGLHADGVS
ncbi:MAG: host specificity protein J [Alphaproteobacteria bacterium HGW-Alphaproteobacteria-4]|nr:MAG: host specificity protein J [Alphaproteobacteria bacterium HGW-Alphaproteobacteria-4]